MEFSEFAQKLYTFIGNGESQGKYTRSLFDAILGDENAALLPKRSDETFKAYYNGQTKITSFAKQIVAYVEDGWCFCEYLQNLTYVETVAQSLCDEFSEILPNATASTIFEELGTLFAQIIKEAAASKRNTTASEPEGNYVDPEVLDDDSDQSHNSTGPTIIQNQVNIKNNTTNNFNIKDSTVTFNL